MIPPPTDAANPYARVDLGAEPSTGPGALATPGSGAADADAAAPEPEAPEAPPREAALAERVAELQAQVLRGAAELDNARKRGRREVEEARRLTEDRLLCDLLPVVDNLERALQHANSDAQDPVATGVGLVLKQFRDFLGRHQVSGFVSLGTPFDPSRHEAIGQEASGELPAHTVLRELQQGYTIGTRLLRPARVVVAMAPPETP